MVIRLDKPLIATQLDRAAELVCRVRDGHLICVFIFGPKGIGKDSIVEAAYAESDVHLKQITDATLIGMRRTFIADPFGHFWFNDNDKWMKEQREANFLKHALQGGNIDTINANTLRQASRANILDSVIQVKSQIRLIVTSNASFDALSDEQRNHVEAVTDRGRIINISSDPHELLKFLDWWIVEQDFFTTAIFRNETNINRRLNLREVQDVLDFLHTYAWQIRLSLRMVREIAVERVMSPLDWEAKLKVGLEPKPRLKTVPPPAPEMFGRNVREGRPIRPTGYEQRQAKRLAKQAPPADPEPEPPVTSIEPPPPDPPPLAPKQPRLKTKETAKAEPAAPAGPSRLSREWFTAQVLAMTSGLFRKALITADEAKTFLQAMNDEKTLVLRAVFPPVLDLDSSAWLNIKPKSFETGHPRQAEQPTIADIPWQHLFELDHASAVLAQHRMGGDSDFIDAHAFAAACKTPMTFGLKDAMGVLRRKPEMWGISERGVMGAVLERDDIIYEYFLRARPK